MAKMKDDSGNTLFICNLCGRVAGASHVEQAALASARIVARREGWEWKHPGWQLTCPDCKERKGNGHRH